MTLKIKLLSGNAFMPKKKSHFAAGYDLYSAYKMDLPKKGKVLIKTDISMEIPKGYYGRIAPRSGLAVKHFIDVGAGVIDSDYRGNISILLFNFSNTDFSIKKGDRIAQLILCKIGNFEIIEVDKLGKTERGKKGLGSTGIK